MKYRELGNTGITVSEVAMGSEGLENKPYEEVKALIDTCLECGINFYDMFNPNPATRQNFGKAMAGKRDQYVIQGHICSAWQNDQYLRTRDMNLVKESFENLLRDLDTDFIDVGMIHFVDSREDLDGVLNGPVSAYVRELKANGTIKAIGISTHNTEIAMRAMESGLAEVIMCSINPAFDLRPASENIDELFEPKSYEDAALAGMDPERERLYAACAANGVALTVMKAFGGGVLLDGNKSPFNTALTPMQCLHYALTRPGVASVLAGCFTPEQVRDAARYSDCAEEEKDYSVTLSSAPRHSYSGKCMYCGHCAPCTVGIDIAMVNKYLDLALSISEDGVPQTVLDHYRRLEHHASECIDCGICETNCPFEVKIMEKMAQAADVFGE